MAFLVSVSWLFSECHIYPGTLKNNGRWGYTANFVECQPTCLSFLSPFLGLHSFLVFLGLCALFFAARPLMPSLQFPSSVLHFRERSCSR